MAQGGKHQRSGFSLCAPSLLPILSTHGGSKVHNFSHFPEAPAFPKDHLPGPSFPETGPLSLWSSKRNRKPAKALMVWGDTGPKPAGNGDPQVWAFSMPCSSHSPRPHFPQMRISFSGPDVFPRQMLHLGSSPGTPAERKRPSRVRSGSQETAVLKLHSRC